MQFKIGDLVVHPVFGTGHIVEIEEKQISEQGTHLYYKVALLERTVWIPVEAHEVSGLRPATVKSELDQYRNLLKSHPSPLNINLHQRHLELTKRLKQGSFQVVCEIVRDLTASGWRMPLNATDTATLQKTRKSLHQEWAIAAGVSITEAIKEVDSLLLATRQEEIG
jgi:RNA polymerase-interacting CarD/CdnL/TRCF family regulator